MKLNLLLSPSIVNPDKITGMNQKTLLLIDANSLIHRSFHALPPFMNKAGEPTGALYGLANVLMKIDREDHPEYMVACFDRPEPTFRKKMFDDYKIHRPKTADELVTQIIEAKNVFRAFGIKTFEAPGFEADDLIGTAIEKFKNEPDLKIMILTGDLDTLQLIDNDKIKVKVFRKGITDTMIYDEAAVKKRYGISPESLPDYKGLIGDTSDNIPGVPGIGPKTAAELLGKYKTLENFLEKGRDEKAYGKIAGAKDQMLLSKQLGTIRRDAPLEIKNVSEMRYDGIRKEKVVPYFEKNGFHSLIKRVDPLSEAPEHTSPKKKKAVPQPQSNTLF